MTTLTQHLSAVFTPYFPYALDMLVACLATESPAVQDQPKKKRRKSQETRAAGTSAPPVRHAKTQVMLPPSAAATQQCCRAESLAVCRGSWQQPVDRLQEPACAHTCGKSYHPTASSTDQAPGLFRDTAAHASPFDIVYMHGRPCELWLHGPSTTGEPAWTLPFLAGWWTPWWDPSGRGLMMKLPGPSLGPLCLLPSRRLLSSWLWLAARTPSSSRSTTRWDGRLGHAGGSCNPICAGSWICNGAEGDHRHARAMAWPHHAVSSTLL